MMIIHSPKGVDVAQSLWRDLLNSKYGAPFFLPSFILVSQAYGQQGWEESGDLMPKAALGSWVFTEAERQM